MAAPMPPRQPRRSPNTRPGKNTAKRTGLRSTTKWINPNRKRLKQPRAHVEIDRAYEGEPYVDATRCPKVVQSGLDEATKERFFRKPNHDNLRSRERGEVIRWIEYKRMLGSVPPSETDGEEGKDQRAATPTAMRLSRSANFQLRRAVRSKS